MKLKSMIMLKKKKKLIILSLIFMKVNFNFLKIFKKNSITIERFVKIYKKIYIKNPIELE